jgi:hypothetical protein
MNMLTLPTCPCLRCQVREIKIEDPSKPFSEKFRVCKFTLPPKVTIDEYELDLANTKYYLTLAYGGTKGDGRCNVQPGIIYNIHRKLHYQPTS